MISGGSRTRFDNRLTPALGGALRVFGGLGREVADQGGRASARFYLKRVVFPVIDGIAEKEKLTLDEQVTNMIRRGETLRSYAQRPEFSKRVEETLGSPTACFLLGKFRPHLSKPEHEIRASVPWWIERIGETRPEVCRVIRGQPGGERWLGDMFVDMIQICREYAG